MDILENLNEQQKEAVLAADGPLLILAGAGSGKTLTLTSKIAYLIKARGTHPANILAVTFTNRAAGEMKERVARICGEPLGALNIGTFHSVCLNIIRENIELCGLKKRFVIFDAKDQETVLKAIIKEFELDEDKFAPEIFSNQISKLKNKLIGAERFAEESGRDFLERTLVQVYLKYEERLRENNALDFDDMIGRCVALFKNNADTLARYQEKFKYILIDEYQDTNHAQYQFIRLLAQARRNICAVGDNDQAIYGWRQADIANILNFEKDYPDAKIITLEENYRSTQNILSAANNVIKKNKTRREKNLFTRGATGEKIRVVLALNEKKEAEYAVKKIKELSRREKLSLSDCAVLYRTNAQSREMEEAFMKAGLPYLVIGGFKFYERKEIKDMLCYLRHIHNENDAVSLKRIINSPSRGIGEKSLKHYLVEGKKTPAIERFFELIVELRERQKDTPLPQFIRLVAKKSGFEEKYKNGSIEDQSRWENILELAGAAAPSREAAEGAAGEYSAAPPEEALELFLQRTAIAGNEGTTDQKNAVRLMTMHSAKGLEFGAVFVVGLEENIFPHSRSKNSPEELEEERRLCYVAITRAKKYLYLLCARTRRIYGQTQANAPSRFLYDIPEHLSSAEEYGLEYSLKNLDLEDDIVDIG